jgi:hypothetical protein
MCGASFGRFNTVHIHESSVASTMADTKDLPFGFKGNVRENQANRCDVVEHGGANTSKRL